VGPRPERPHFVSKLREVIPYYDERHSVRPGITGWAQVKFPYGSTLEDAEEKLEYDLFYVKHMSLLLDAAILLETAKVMLLGRGR
jgi:lipopolysaccharide/colanic/teichoic acid biosynthesis glycosyltransferase